MQINAHSFLSRLVPAIFLQKEPRLRLPEPVDALLHISHHEPVLPTLPAGTDAVQNRLLHQITVLIFIHHDLCKIICKKVRRLRGNQLSVLLPGQDLQGQMFLIGKIKDIFLPFLLIQPLQEPKRQLRIDLHMFRRPAHLFHGSLPGQRKILLHQSFQSVLYAVSDVHDLPAQCIIRIRHGFGAAAGKPLKPYLCHKLLVCFHTCALHQFLQKFHISTQRFFIGPGTERCTGDGKRPLDLSSAVSRRRPKLCKHRVRSRKVLPGRALGHLVHSRTGGQPPDRLGAGHGIFIELQNQLCNTVSPVSASVALRKADEFRPAFLMSFLQELIHCILLQQTHLALVSNAEAGIQTNCMKIVPDYIETESVNCGDLCSGHQRLLPLDPRIPRILLQALLKRLPDPFLHLPGRRLGKGRDQQPVHIHWTGLVRDHRQDPFHQHSSLAGACGRGYQKVPLPCIYDLFLVVCP